MNLLQRIWREIKISFDNSKTINKIRKQKPVIEKTNTITTAYKVFIALTLIIIALILLLLKVIFGSTGDEIRTSAFVKERSYTDYTNAKRGDILASDGRIISMEVPRYKLTLDFQSDILTATSVSRYRDSIQYQKEVDSLDALLEDELDSLAVLICDKTNLGRKYGLNKKKLRASWRKGKIQRKKNGDLNNRDIPMLGYTRQSNPSIDWASYQELVAQAPFKAIKRKSDLAIEQKTERKKRYKSLLRYMYNTARYIEFARDYPFGRLANATIGTCFQERDSVHYSHGRSGMELYLDSLLRGKVGTKLVTKSCGVTLREDSISKAVNGYNVHTTLDMNMQNILHTELEKQCLQYKAKSGHAILLEVKTGAIKAIVNLDRKVWKGNAYYVEDYNHALFDMIQPGSTIKTASMLIALDKGLVRPDDIIDTGNGKWKFGGSIRSDWKRGGFGKITASQIIKYSSNIGIAKIITRHYWDKQDTYAQKKEGFNQYIKQLKNIGFDYDLDLPIFGAKKPKIMTWQERDAEAPKDKWGNKLRGGFSAVDFANVTFGYYALIPSIYMVNFYNAVANDGRLMKPYIISRITEKDKDGNENIIEEFQPTVIKQAICKPQTAKEIQAMLRTVVAEKGGTGHNHVRSELIAISGKSATAEIGKTHKRVAFCGFFPSEAPRYTCIAVLDRCPKGTNPHGGSSAGPVIKNLAEHLLPLGSPKPIQGTKKTKVSRDKQETKDKFSKKLPKSLPSFIGMTPSEANYLANRCGYKTHFEGHGRVVKQNIPSGHKVKKGTTIRLTLK